LFKPEHATDDSGKPVLRGNSRGEIWVVDVCAAEISARNKKATKMEARTNMSILARSLY